MDVEDIARKLEPLMPREVNHWLRARDSADAELKAMIDRQIVETAYRKLGDFRKKPLLSLPSPKAAAGPFRLGTVVYEKDKWPFGLSGRELLQNLAILGRSGAGKTNVAFGLLQHLVDRKIPFLFLDWKRTVRHLLPAFKRKVMVYTPGRELSPFRFNPLIPPPGLERNVYLNQFIDVMADAFTLGEGAKRILQKAIAERYAAGDVAPNIATVLHDVENMPGHARAQAWKVSAMRALESLAFAQLTETQGLSQEQMVQQLLRGQTVIELDALDQSSKRFLIPMLCLWLYYLKLGANRRESLDLLVFIEEAHHVLYQEQRVRESAMTMLLRQCRELGIGTVIVDQHAHLLSSAALGNTYTSFVLNQKHPSDINRAAAMCLLDDSDKRWLSMLPVGCGIVKLQDRWRRPFVVRFPLITVAKGAVTDEVLRAYLASATTGSAAMALAGERFWAGSADSLVGYVSG